MSETTIGQYTLTFEVGQGTKGARCHLCDSDAIVLAVVEDEGKPSKRLYEVCDKHVTTFLDEQIVPNLTGIEQSALDEFRAVNDMDLPSCPKCGDGLEQIEMMGAPDGVIYRCFGCHEQFGSLAEIELEFAVVRSKMSELASRLPKWNLERYVVQVDEGVTCYLFKLDGGWAALWNGINQAIVAVAETPVSATRDMLIAAGWSTAVSLLRFWNVVEQEDKAEFGQDYSALPRAA